MHRYEIFRNLAKALIQSKDDKKGKKLVKSLWRKQYLNRYYRNTQKIPFLINTWERLEDFEVRHMVAIFKNSQKAMEYIEENYNFEREYNNLPYDCTGKWYSEGAKMKIIGDRIFITEKSYLDV